MTLYHLQICVAGAPTERRLDKVWDFKDQLLAERKLSDEWNNMGSERHMATLHRIEDDGDLTYIMQIGPFSDDDEEEPDDEQ